MMINAIVFDFYDTLADTMPARATATQAVFDEVHIDAFTGDQFLTASGASRCPHHPAYPTLGYSRALVSPG